MPRVYSRLVEFCRVLARLCDSDPYFDKISFFGFHWAAHFYPVANQGSLLGIIFTGPMGFLAETAGGAIYWRIRSKSKNKARARWNNDRLNHNDWGRHIFPISLFLRLP